MPAEGGKGLSFWAVAVGATMLRAGLAGSWLRVTGWTVPVVPGLPGIGRSVTNARVPSGVIAMWRGALGRETVEDTPAAGLFVVVSIMTNCGVGPPPGWLPKQKVPRRATRTNLALGVIARSTGQVLISIGVLMTAWWVTVSMALMPWPAIA
ncbi:MAG: hypothetical protein NVSMB32_02240 [Actinomycetota bacterium]